MARRKIKRYIADDTYVLTGPGDTHLERKLPSGNDGVALSWAVGVLLYKEGDIREGSVVPIGDYLLTLVGPVKDEPVYNLHKHEYEIGRVLISWDPA